MKDKYIKSATIYFAGDNSVGIRSASFTMECFFSLDELTNDSEQHSILAKYREKISDLYEEIMGESPTWVMFDFEIESEIKSENDFYDLTNEL